MVGGLIGVQKVISTLRMNSLTSEAFKNGHKYLLRSNLNNQIKFKHFSQAKL